MTISLRKREANRRNAASSTGPRTRAGKAAVCGNALTHGLTAEVVLPGEKAARTFQEFCAQLWADCAPVGAREQALVELMALARWRMTQGRRAEAGERARARAAAQRRDRELERETVAAARAALPALDARAQLRQSIRGVKYLGRVLAAAREELDTSGTLSESTEQRLVNHFGGALPRGTLPSAEGDSIRPDLALRAWMGAQADAMTKRLAVLRQRAAAARRIEVACGAIPPSRAMDKLQRYETAAERRYYRAQRELERLQRRRQGEMVPPPLTVEMTRDA